MRLNHCEFLMQIRNERYKLSINYNYFRQGNSLDKEGINCFLNNWHDHFDGDPNQCQLYLDVKEGIAPQGIEYYLKLFFDQTATLFDYLPNTTRIFTQSGLEEASKTFWQEVNHRFEEYGIDRQRPLLQPKHVFVAIEALFSQLMTAYNP